jgi:hypothetical protein
MMDARFRGHDIEAFPSGGHTNPALLPVVAKWKPAIFPPQVGAPPSGFNFSSK